MVLENLAGMVKDKDLKELWYINNISFSKI